MADIDKESKLSNASVWFFACMNPKYCQRSLKQMGINKDELRVLFMGTGGDSSVAALMTIKNMGIPIVGVVQNYPKTKRVSLYDIYVRSKSLFKTICGTEIPYLGTEDVNARETEQWIRERRCNLICICSAYQLMKENIMDIPEYGVLNAHGALLPDYRGPNPPYWCFRNMESAGGVTLHFVNKGEDTGDIIVRHKHEIPFGMSMEEYEKEQMKCVEKCYRDGLCMLLDGTVAPMKQGRPKTAKARRVTREDFLLDYGNWEVERTYHFLHGTGGVSWIYEGRLYNYVTTGYKKTDRVSNGKFDIQCKDGYVVVKRSLIKPKRLVKNILKGIFVRL